MSLRVLRSQGFDFLKDFELEGGSSFPLWRGIKGEDFFKIIIQSPFRRGGHPFCELVDEKFFAERLQLSLIFWFFFIK